MAEGEGDWKGERPKARRLSEAVVIVQASEEEGLRRGRGWEETEEETGGRDTSDLEKITAFKKKQKTIQTYTKVKKIL